MSNLISIAINYQVTGLPAIQWNQQDQITQNVAGASGGQMACTTVYSSLAYGTVPTGSIAYFRLQNLDTTQTIDIGFSGTACLKLLPGELQLWRSYQNVQWQAKTETGTAILFFGIDQN